jgi:hypothetical protein
MANHTTVSWHDHGKRTLFSIQVPKLPQRLIAMNYTKIAIMGGAGGCGVNQQLHHHMMVMTIVVFQSNHQFILSAKLKLMMKIHHATTMDCQKWPGIIYPMYLSSSNLCGFPAIPSPPSNIPISHSVQCRGRISVPSSNPTTIN